jgi:hypothetical protein
VVAPQRHRCQPPPRTTIGNRSSAVDGDDVPVVGSGFIGPELTDRTSTGLPTMQNTHEVAQGHNPAARIVYVDNDPLVLAHARSLLVNTTPEGVTTYVHADVREPETILAAVANMLNFDRPVAVVLLGIKITRKRFIVTDTLGLGPPRTNYGLRATPPCSSTGDGTDDVMTATSAGGRSGRHSETDPNPGSTHSSPSKNDAISSRSRCR